MTLVFAVMHLYNIFNFLLLLSIPFLYFYFKSGIDKSIEWSIIPACPSLKWFFFFFFFFVCVFFDRGETERTNFSKILCSMFVYVLLYVSLCHD